MRGVVAALAALGVGAGIWELISFRRAREEREGSESEGEPRTGEPVDRVATLAKPDAALEGLTGPKDASRPGGALWEQTGLGVAVINYFDENEPRYFQENRHYWNEALEGLIDDRTIPADQVERVRQFLRQRFPQTFGEVIPHLMTKTPPPEDPKKASRIRDDLLEFLEPTLNSQPNDTLEETP
jgi:hypothetical protein